MTCRLCPPRTINTRDFPYKAHKMQCHTKYSIARLAAMMQADCIADSAAQQKEVCTLLIDSRIVRNASQAVFFALRSSRQDGHSFIPDAYAKGVRAFVVDSPVDTAAYAQAVFLVVPQVLEALQKVAAAHRQLMRYPVLGITGSNGKTIVKEWIYQCLRHEKRICRSPKSYNSQIGVPLSLWQMHLHDDMAVIEAGISQPHEMSALRRMIQPTIGLLTNVGQAHLLAFENKKALAQEKLQLFAAVDTLIYNSDDAVVHALVEQRLAPERVFAWGRKPHNSLQLISHAIGDGGSTLQLRYQGAYSHFFIPFTDAASLQNAMHVCAFLLQQGYDMPFVAKQMACLQKVEMRLEIIQAQHACTLINDAYSFDEDSLRIALELLQQQPHRNKTLILSDMPAVAMDKAYCHALNRQLKEAGVQKLIAIGEQLSAHAEAFEMEAYFYPHTMLFLQSPQRHSFYNEGILLKGARSFGFERIAKALALQHHQTRLEVHLDRMLDNLHFFKRMLKPNTGVMLMVKAFAYGSGSKEIANFLQYHRADYLAVAYTDEGIRLRQAGIQTPIMVMNADHNNMAALIQHRLEPEVFSFHTLDVIEALLPILLPKGERLALHIKCDTGMHRLGFEHKDMPQLIARISANSSWYIQSVFTHLAAADMPQEDAFSMTQIGRFEASASHLQAAFPQQHILRHVLNSVGIARFPQYQYDMVRLGIGLYGFSPVASVQQHLQQIHVLKTEVSQVKHLQKGESVGYARRHVCQQHTVVATVPIGYADGMHRHLGNGAYSMQIRGQAVPIIGNVCMDMCMLDVSAIDEVQVGEEVVVFACQKDVEKMATQGGSIAYEVLTSISERVQRVYVKE